MISKIRFSIVLFLFALTWYAMEGTAEVRTVPIKKSLSQFPQVIGGYSLSNSLQSSSDVVEMLGVSDYIQYNYMSPNGGHINLYVGFYEAVGVGGGYHSPRNCIPGGGWGIDGVNAVSLNTGINGEEHSTVSEMIIRRGDQFQVVYYWYQNRGRIIASEYWEKVYQVLDALFKGRRDGTFVRIMSAVPETGTITQVRAEVKEFSEQVMTTLEEYLPGARI